MEENTSKAYVGTAGPNPIAAGSGTGSPLFVINLCASIAPVQTSGNLPGLDNYRMYQVARVEDGRTRHRLRLGFFTSESHAEGVLTVVRQQYPTAFTTCLCDEDRKFARGYLPDSAIAAAVPKRPAPAVSPSAPAPAVAKPAAAVAAKVTPPVSKPVTAPAAPATAKAPAPAAAKPAAPKTPAPAEPEIVEVTWEPELTATARPVAANAAPAPKLSALSPDAGLDEFTWEPPALQPAAASASVTARQPVLPAVFKTQPVTKAAPAAPKADSAASQRVAALKADSATSQRIPALKVDTAASQRVKALALKLDTATSQRVQALKSDPAASQRVAVLKSDTATTQRVPALKVDPAMSQRVAALKTDTASTARVATLKVNPSTSARLPALKTDTATSMRVAKLTLSEPPAPVAKAPNGTPAQPFHVGKGVEIADMDIELESDLPTQPLAEFAPKAPAIAAKAHSAAPGKAAPATHAPVAARADPARKVPAAPPASSPIAAAAAKPAVPGRIQELPELDSTQTIRALTSDELSDEQQEKWFAIQLAASEQPVNLDAMPRLDIFEAYRLYSVASAGSGKIVHSLRLGFFKEAVSAEAVSGYLKTFFGSPTVLRVSVAEHARFKDAPAPKKAGAGGKSESKVVEFSQARASGARPAIPTVTMEVSGGADTSATGSFKTGASGSFKMNATGKHKALNPPSGAAPKRSNGTRKSTGASGKHKIMPKSLSEQLLEEAREVELSESGIRRLPKNESLLSRLVDKLTNK